jgi:hypothetical protein
MRPKVQWPKAPPITNKQRYCQCGSGYMPTILWQSQNRWACNACYGKPRPHA